MTNIHETAFDGCYQLTIHCDAGSVADQFAQEFYVRQSEMRNTRMCLITSMRMMLPGMAQEKLLTVLQMLPGNRVHRTIRQRRLPLRTARVRKPFWGALKL